MVPHQNSVYIVFYARCNNPHARFICTRPIDSLLDIGIDILTGPFTHCHIAWGMRNVKVNGKTEVGVLCTKLTPSLGSVTTKIFPERDNFGDCYLQLLLSDTEYNLLRNTIDNMIKRKDTYFSWGEFFGFKSPPKATEAKQGWTCASFVGFLMQKITLIDRKVDVNKLNVTLLYLLLRQNTRSCKQVSIYPFNNKKEVILTADEIYIRRMNKMSAAEIPVRIFPSGVEDGV